MKKEKKIKRRLKNRKPAERYEWLLALRKGSDCILDPVEKYRIYRRLEDEFGELSGLEDEEAEGFTLQEQCAIYAGECAKIADKMQSELPEDISEYSRTEMMSAGRRQKENEQSEGSHKFFRWVLLALIVLVAAVFIARKIPASRAVIGDVEQYFGFNSFAIKSYRIAGDTSDGWAKAVALEQKVVSQTAPGSKVKFGKGEWIVLSHDHDQTLLIASEPIRDRKFDKDGSSVWTTSSLRSYLSVGFIRKNFYNGEADVLAATNWVDKTATTETTLTTAGMVSSYASSDQVFIASEEDVDKYDEEMGSLVKNLRLRDPGEYPGTTKFVSAEGDVIDEGFPADMPGCYVRPMIRVIDEGKPGVDTYIYNYGE